MNICVVTGSGGLIGSESVDFFADKFDLVIGIDNDLRSYFFGKEASTTWNKNKLEEKFQNYKHYNIDIRNNEELEKIFKEYNQDIKLIIFLKYFFQLFIVTNINIVMFVILKFFF